MSESLIVVLHCSEHFIFSYCPSVNKSQRVNKTHIFPARTTMLQSVWKLMSSSESRPTALVLLLLPHFWCPASTSILSWLRKQSLSISILHTSIVGLQPRSLQKLSQGLGLNLTCLIVESAIWSMSWSCESSLQQSAVGVKIKKAFTAWHVVSWAGK